MFWGSLMLRHLSYDATEDQAKKDHKVLEKNVIEEVFRGLV